MIKIATVTYEVCIAAKPSSKRLPIATCTKSRAIVGPAPMLED